MAATGLEVNFRILNVSDEEKSKSIKRLQIIFTHLDDPVKGAEKIIELGFAKDGETKAEIEARIREFNKPMTPDDPFYDPKDPTLSFAKMVGLKKLYKFAEGDEYLSAVKPDPKPQFVLESEAPQADDVAQLLEPVATEKEDPKAESEASSFDISPFGVVPSPFDKPSPAPILLNVSLESHLSKRKITHLPLLIRILKYYESKLEPGAVPDPELAFRRAASKGNVTALKALKGLVLDLDINQPGKSGKTAIVYAKEFQKSEAFEYLQSIGAKIDTPSASTGPKIGGEQTKNVRFE